MKLVSVPISDLTELLKLLLVLSHIMAHGNRLTVEIHPRGLLNRNQIDLGRGVGGPKLLDIHLVHSYRAIKSFLYTLLSHLGESENRLVPVAILSVFESIGVL